MYGVAPVQSYVDVPHEMTEAERNRPRHGRPPVRKPRIDGPSADEPGPETPPAPVAG